MTNPAYRVIVSDGQTTRTTLIFTSSTTWTVPVDWNSGYNFIEGIGGGGGGNYQGAGGGGGAYTNTGNVILSPGASVPIVIGAAGTNGGNGGNTTFNTSTLVAQGGGGGLSLNGLGGQASLCIPSNTAQSGGNGGIGTNQFSSITYAIGGAGGGGGGAAGPNYQGLPGGSGNMFVGGGGGGGAGGLGSLGGFPGTFSSGTRIGGTGGAGPLAIGGGLGSTTTGSAGTTGGGGGAGGIGNIAVVYNAGAGGVYNTNGNPTVVSTLGITVTAFGGNGNVGGTTSSTVTGARRQSIGGNGGPEQPQTSGFDIAGGGGGIGGGPGLVGTGGQSVDFQGLRSVVENLGYSWTAPGVQNYPNNGTPATGFGCGGGGGYRTSVFGNRGGGTGLWGGGGGGAGAAGTLGGSGGDGVVVVQTVTAATTANLLLTGNGVYIPPAGVVTLKIWAIGGGSGGRSGSNNALAGGGAGGIAYMEITGGYQGGSGGRGGNGTVSANGWSNNTALVGPGGGGGGGMLSRAVTDSAIPAQGTAGSGGFYGGGSGGGGGSYVAGAPGLLAITYQPFIQASTTIDVDDLLVLKSSVIPSNLSSVGYNVNGQLGLGSPPTQISSPQQIGTNTQWANFSAGYINSGAITGAGNLFVWGSNSQGQLGLGVPTGTIISTPVQLGTSTWKQLAWGGGVDACFILALATNGNIWSSGNNTNACLGDGTAGGANNKTSLVQVAVNRNNWKSVTAGYFYALALANDNTLWGWGNRALAWSSATASASTPVQLGTDTWESINGGHNFAMALTADGSLYGWGNNTYGQLGLNDITTRTSPARVGAIGGWRAVACGKDHTLAIANNGTLWSWGNNFLGQLGINVSSGSRSSPVQIGTLTTWQLVSANESTSLAVRSDGTLWTWGNNIYGGLGLGDTTSRSSPTQVGTNINWKTASMGQLHMLLAAYPNMSLPPLQPGPFALFGGGYFSFATTEKYIYSTDTVLGSTALGATFAELAAAGNITRGIFGGGGGYGYGFTNATYKYTYSGDTVAGGTVLGQQRYGLAAVGNSTRGIFGGGLDSSNFSSWTDKYTYSSDAVARGTALGTARRWLAAAGNSTQGIFGGGEGGGLYIYDVTNVTDKYTYSSDGRVSGQNLGAARSWLAAAGNSTQGIFGGGLTPGYSAYTDKYTYATDAVAAGTVLGTARYGLAAAGNSTQGIFGGGRGEGGVTAITEKYTYSGDAVASGTNLGTARYGLAAASSSPGGF